MAAARRAEYFRGRVEAPRRSLPGPEPPTHYCNRSGGGVPESGDNPQLVLKAADEAMYRAESRGEKPD